MDKKFIISLCSKKWPSYAGIIIKKNLLVENLNNLLKSLEILIIDPQFSVISLSTTYQDGIVYNFIYIPLNNIENVLVNEKFDRKGSILELIANGEVLHAKKTEIIEQIQKKALSLYNKENHLTTREYLNAVKRLHRVRKGFSKHLKPYQKFFLINEAVSIVAEAELIKNSHWLIGGHNKSTFLYDNSPTIVNELIKLTTYSYQDLNSDYFMEFALYLDYYLANLVMPVPIKKIKLSDIFVISLKFHDDNLTIDIGKIISEIKNNELFGKHYQYFHLSRKSHFNIYKNAFTLIFNRPHKLTNVQAYKYLIKIIENSHQSAATISFLQEEYLTDENLNKGFYNKFYLIGKQIGILCENHISNNKNLDREKLFFISIIVNSYIIKLLNFTIEDIVKINFYLVIRYMFNHREQDQIQSAETMSAVRQQKYQLYQKYYQDNSKIIESLVNKGLSHNLTDNTKEYNNTLKEIFSALELIDLNFQEIATQNLITISILENIYEIIEVRKALIYTLLFEYIMTLLNLESQQIGLCSYAISETILNKKQTELQVGKN